MTRSEEVARVAEVIRGQLAGGKWHHTVGLGGWGVPGPVVGDALNVLAREEAIEHNAARNTYRLTPVAPVRQLTVYDKEA